MFKLALAALVWVLPAVADSMPYRYFYTCSSGVVNCANFPVNYHGDFGMTGLRPSELDQMVGLGPTVSEILSSNVHGEVLGRVSGFALDAVMYGANGSLHCVIAGCLEYAQSAVSINNNGLYLLNVYRWSMLGSGGQAAPLTLDPVLRNQLAIEFGVSVASLGPDPGNTYSYSEGFGNGLGLNDQNQILFRFNADPDIGLGVLSQSAIPEPSTIALLATLLCGFGVLIHRKLRLHRECGAGREACPTDRGD